MPSDDERALVRELLGRPPLGAFEIAVRDADGLPVGLQLVARSFAEETLFSLATAFEKYDPELDRRPSR